MESEWAAPEKAEMGESGWVTSSDGLLQMRAPEHWEVRNDLHAEASLQMGSYNLDQYMLVLVESVEEFDGTLREHSDSTSASLMAVLTELRQTQPSETLIGW